MNYHKYVFVPTPARSDIAADTTPTATSSSSVPSDGISSDPASGTSGVPDGGSPTNEKSVPDTAVSGSPEPATSGIKREPVATGDTEPSQEAAVTKNSQTKSMFRRPLSGELGQRLYNMPPLPPTATTLTAFKTLLLDRLRLLHIAGKFHVDNVLGIPRQLQQELNAETSGAAVRQLLRTAEANVNPPGSGSSVTDISEAPHAPLERRYPEANLAVSYPQIVRSDLQAQHWIKVIRNTHDYQMLRSRFLSAFLWPALLSSTRVEERGEMTDERTEPVASLLGSGRLVVNKEQEQEEEEKADENFSAPDSPPQIRRKAHE